MQARYYDPVIGRFYSNDPIDAVSHLSNEEGVMGFNRYSYAVNNPYKYTDPDGRCITGILTIPCGIAIAAAFGTYKIGKTVSDSSDKAKVLVEQKAQRSQKVDKMYEALAGIKKGTHSADDVNKATGDVQQANESVVDAVTDLAKTASQLPGTTMTGPAPASVSDLASSGAVDAVKDITKAITKEVKETDENN